MLILNFALALIWMVLQRGSTLVDFGVGFVLGFFIISISQSTLQNKVDLPILSAHARSLSYPQQVWKTLSFIGFGLWSIIKANLAVAKIVISPKLDIHPGILAIPLDVKSEVGITVLANLITLTPGTVTLDISTDKSTLYVHCIDIKNADEIYYDIKHHFERRVMELFP